ncbi:hypothetical protein WJX81_005092 [Elliptochloris bilobata]|uniref:CW-type domain-containing protein n=1 Tax=Elliptochloris bilobata TaxID=381761 RepID=A0AAW1SC49_9CHLO
MGQRPALAAGSDDDFEEELAGGSMQALGDSTGALSSSGVHGSRAGTGGRRGAPTLRDLVEAGITPPGRNRITVVYKGVTYTASLGHEGLILYQGRKFATASAFSIHCKRLQTPGKQGDDGWKSVLYEGQPLERFRRRLAACRSAPPSRSASQAALNADAAGLDEDNQDGDAQPIEDVAAAGAGAGQASDGAEAAAEPATDQWVQCDRCRTWRIVPDSEWPKVEADPRDVWYCEDASWDVQQYHPQTEPCISR